MMAFVAAAPDKAQAQTIDMTKTFSMQVLDPKSAKILTVPVNCATLDTAQPTVITFGFAEQFHRALSDMRNLGDFQTPANKKVSAGPLMIHIAGVHEVGKLFAKILEGKATPADINRYTDDPSRDSPIVGAKWVCEGKPEKLSPIYTYDPASATITLDLSKM